MNTFFLTPDWSLPQCSDFEGSRSDYSKLSHSSHLNREQELPNSTEIFLLPEESKGTLIRIKKLGPREEGSFLLREGKSFLVREQEGPSRERRKLPVRKQ